MGSTPLAYETDIKGQDAYRFVIENASEGIVVIKDQKAVFMNPKVSEIIGYSKEELLSQPFYKYIHPDDHKMVIENYKKRVKGEDAPFEYSFRTVGSDNNINWIEVRTVVTTWDETPATINFFNVITDRKKSEDELDRYRDDLEFLVEKRTSEIKKANEKLKKEVAEKKRIEQALIEREEIYRSVFENTGTGTLIIEKDMTISKANVTLEELTGYTKKEVEGKIKWTAFVDGPELDRLIKLHNQRRVSDDTPTEYDFTLTNKFGKKIDCFLKIAMIPGTDSSVVSIIDISSRTKAEEALKKAHDELEIRVEERTQELIKAKEETDASARAKSEFLANMSHEIRTPMNAILGMTDLLHGTELSRKQKEYLNIVRSSSRSLLELINDILDFSKIDAGKLSFENIPFSIREVLEEVSDMFLERNLRKEIEFILDIDSDVPRVMITDPLRLRQVLSNLTSNAFKFTEHGEICISVKKIYSENSKTQLLFSVRDTGVGINPEISDSLFDAFAQADGSTTRKYGGTGLGLAICKKLVNMMDGEIWVESELGTGSTFFFTGWFKTVQENIPCNTNIPPTVQDIKVLLVEDNPSTLIVLKRFLNSFGLRTEMANTGKTAIDLYKKSLTDDPFDLVILDLSLKDMNGIDVADQIKNKLSDDSPHVILLSRFGREKEIQRAKRTGIDSFLVKPVKQSVLLDTIMGIFGFKISRPSPKGSGLAAPEEFSDLSILLVEDNHINQMVANEILQEAGITIETAQSGKEAIEKVNSKIYDAVLMDVQMPEMDGLEATKIIRSELNINDLPIIAMTAHAMYGDKEKCISSGMNDYLSKPIDRKELFSVLRRNVTRIRKLSLPSTSEVIAIKESSASRKYSIEGLNIDEGLERLGGSWESYISIIGAFCKDFKDFSSDFRTNIENSNIKSAAIMAHSLKGAAGNISANELYLAAKALEKSCIENNLERLSDILYTTEDQLSVICNSYRKLNSNRQHSYEEAGGPHFATELSDIIEFFERLDKSLVESDPVGSENHMEAIKSILCKESLPVEITDLFSSLEDNISDYDFETACTTLSRAARKLRKLYE